MSPLSKEYQRLHHNRNLIRNVWMLIACVLFLVSLFLESEVPLVAGFASFVVGMIASTAYEIRGEQRIRRDTAAWNMMVIKWRTKAGPGDACWWRAPVNSYRLGTILYRDHERVIARPIGTDETVELNICYLYPGKPA